MSAAEAKVHLILNMGDLESVPDEAWAVLAGMWQDGEPTVDSIEDKIAEILEDARR